MTIKDNIGSESVCAARAATGADHDRLFPPMADASRLLAACIPADYSASRIARAVEDADAQLVNLNVTSDGAALDNRVVFELRVTHRSPMAVARSLERYGYEVMDMEGDDPDDDAAMSERVAAVLRMLDL